MSYIIQDINKVYKPSPATNITETWRKAGWTPPSESPWYQEKWRVYKTLAMRNAEQEVKQ